jgi:hypothetical protein
MAQPSVYFWSVDSALSVAIAQSPGAPNYAYVLNGDLSYAPNPDSPNRIASFGNCSRTVSVASGFDDSTNNFTITGTYQGNPQTETIAGPNNDTVYTTKLFDTVTSVTVDTTLAGGPADIGAGETGQTWWFKHNPYSVPSETTVQVEVTGTIEYTLVSTLYDVEKVSNPPTFESVSDMIAETASEFGIVSVPALYSAIVINSSTPGGGLTATFLQQGIT